MTQRAESQVVTFFLGNELFAIDTHLIKEIIRFPEITEIPRAPRYLKGIANLRGIITPIIDSRVRLELPESEISSHTRVLILEIGGAYLGLIVDQVKGVINVEEDEVEETPQVVSSEIEKEYISGVIRKEDTLILKLDLEALCKVEMASKNKLEKASFLKEEKEEEKKKVEETQLVTFLVAGEEYAFPIEVVREILRVGEITQVPETPSYILGILSVRDFLLPVVDLRKIYGFSELAEDIKEVVEEIKIEHKEVLKNLSLLCEKEGVLKREDNYEQCGFKKWVKEFVSSSEKINQVMERLKRKDQLFHAKVGEFFERIKSEGKEQAFSFLKKEVFSLGEDLERDFEELKKAISEDIKEDQRILVIEVCGLPVGILVDRIKQVIRVPKDSVEKPPEILKTEKSEHLKGIVKLQEGKRIIMLISEESLFDKKTLEELKKMVEKEEKEKIEEKILAKEEVQLVTFKLGEIEFALPIEDVQEINRVESITNVPRAPYFVEGVMNLRGNVIPIIDLRKRFGMEFRPYDEITKVIIVKFEGKLIGFVVDTVCEVLRTTRESLESPPEIIAGNIDTRFVKAICKLEDKKKIILVIDVLNVLTGEEKEELKSLTEEVEKEESEKKTEKEFVSHSEEKVEVKKEEGEVSKKKLLKKVRDDEEEA
jgi:purine-binding chemotaxis protein CheW